jgi:hypothetical protein
VRVLGTDGSVRLDDMRAVHAGTPWPLRLPLVPDAGAARSWAVEATLLDGSGGALAIARSHGGYVSGAYRETLLCLFDACSSEPCGATEPGCATPGGTCETCEAGACVDAEATLFLEGDAPRCPASCTPSGTSETECADSVDDDCDGAFDCDDSDCSCDPDAGPEPDAGPPPAFDACVGGREDRLALCRDGIDNDCDGTRDCADGAECRFPEAPSACSNGRDDDCNGLVDCRDPACCVAPACDQQRCGNNGLRCCDGVCVDTWADERHCGACRYACRGTRQCVRVPAAAGGLVASSACRCGATSECARGACEGHDGVMLCNCANDLDCPGDATCRMQGAMHHSFCAFP